MAVSVKNAAFVLAAGALALAGCKKSGDTADVSANSSAPASSSAATAAAAPVAPPAGKDWTQVVSVTPEGGFSMGNPHAKVHVVEYASLTCPHCAHFSEESMPLIRDRYIKKGLISYELRNYLRDPFDLTAVLLARCAGPDAFFPLSDQMWADQPNWEGKITKMSAADQARLQALPPEQVRPAIASMVGLDQFVRQRGIPAARVNQCVNDKAAIASLDKVQQEAASDQIQGTPSFLINGKLAEGVYDFASLEPVLKQALAS